MSSRETEVIDFDGKTVAKVNVVSDGGFKNKDVLVVQFTDGSTLEFTGTARTLVHPQVKDDGEEWAAVVPAHYWWLEKREAADKDPVMTSGSSGYNSDQTMVLGQ